MRPNERLESRDVVELMQVSRRRALAQKVDEAADKLDAMGAGLYWLCIVTVAMWLWINW